MHSTLASIELDLPDHRSGKVRESWRLGPDRRVLVTTDRISAFDRVLGTIEHKGQVLNQLAAWWFERTADLVANHVVDLPDPNVLVAVEATPLPVEVVVRARLTGNTSTSMLPRYLAGERELYGHRLPDGLAPHGPLPEPLITPTTKAVDGGHDRPITCDEVVSLGLVDAPLWDRVQASALAVFARGEEVAAAAGFVLADTKYEFGLGPDGELLLIDEIHTPDSSRYWAVDTLTARAEAGEGPQNFDKEPFRLAYQALGYHGDGDPPELPEHVRAETSARYVELYQRLTGLAFEPGRRPIADRVAAAVRSATAFTE
ncbi:MAG: phosphoribosylaminoimidazolesuccinocarboxamide synthase [Actinomycetota bacterium]